MEDGFALVPLKDIVAIILNEFRAKLSKALAVCISSYFHIECSYIPLVVLFCASSGNNLISIMILLQCCTVNSRTPRFVLLRIDFFFFLLFHTDSELTDL